MMNYQETLQLALLDVVNEMYVVQIFPPQLSKDAHNMSMTIQEVSMCCPSSFFLLLNLAFAFI